MMSDYKVEMINDGMQEFFVDFNGPKESNSSEPIYMILVLIHSVLSCVCSSIDFQLDYDVICGGILSILQIYILVC